jgi:bifunctional DNA-binding transcriptional regulator/antitoxin component of YhaV-PrlF toxin-antitoxin module
MKSIQIIGMPVPVSGRGHRIVLDEKMRKQYGIAVNDTVFMERTASGQIQILPASAQPAESCLPKSISAGRFNLPKEWAEENEIKTGSFVYLIMTNNGILVCPGCLNDSMSLEVISWNCGDIR